MEPVQDADDLSEAPKYDFNFAVENYQRYLKYESHGEIQKVSLDLLNLF